MQLDTTMDGVGRLTGDLTPESAAAVQAVLEALGKKRGPEDDRTVAQRYHDALQEGCELLPRACWSLTGSESRPYRLPETLGELVGPLPRHQEWGLAGNGDGGRR